MKRLLRVPAILMAFIVIVWIVRRVPERDEVAEWILAHPPREGTLLDFSGAPGFAWTRLCTVGPYTRDEEIDTLIGFDWRGPENNVQDSHSLFIFVNDSAGFLQRRAAGYVLLTTHPRVTENACYPRDSARFRVADGEYSLELVPAR